MTPEHRIMNEIRLWCGEHGLLCFRCNVGRVRTADGAYFDTGLPTGFSDLLILMDGGKAVFCEVKTQTGRLSEDQLRFKEIVEDRGFSYVVARSLEGFLNFYETVK